LTIAEYSVKKPVTITVLFGLLIGMALSLLPKIAVDLYPSTARPVLSVYTSICIFI